ncbi:MAG: hypothetical protein H7A09_01980 [Oceanospirillaceae bacterium]|nr:hypothetical protein [Oceanospirillaceae bacterium]MCP5334544.1 hypothetical protein [Oceanospirillaceae bacterium]
MTLPILKRLLAPRTDTQRSGPDVQPHVPDVQTPTRVVNTSGPADAIAGKDLSSLFFVHIPKTAGTSFRQAAEDFWGAANVLRNYGPKSPATSQKISELGRDPFELFRLIAELDAPMYTGHVRVDTAVHLFPARRVVTFVRNPEEQVVSHYRHAKRWNGFDGDLRAFILNGGTQNLQSRYMAGLHPELFGLIGITEKYDQSLDMFNAHFGLGFAHRTDNTNDFAGEPLDAELRALLRERNRQDMHLYQRCVALHTERWRLFEQGLEWTHGVIGNLTKQSIQGWAYGAVNDEPVGLDILVNDELIGHVDATEPRPNLKQYETPRCGYVGFTLAADLKEGDRVAAIVSRTGQRLREKVFREQK